MNTSNWCKLNRNVSNSLPGDLWSFKELDILLVASLHTRAAAELAYRARPSSHTCAIPTCKSGRVQMSLVFMIL